MPARSRKSWSYSYELWTYKLLTTHVRQHCAAAGHPALQKLSRSKLHKILSEGDLRPHKIRYYVERRDPAFEAKMANVLHVYKEVEIVHDGSAARHPPGVRDDDGLLRRETRYSGAGRDHPGSTAGGRAGIPVTCEDYEYERLGTVSLLAGLDSAAAAG